VADVNMEELTLSTDPFEKPEHESPLPWAIWSLAYVLGLGAVVLRWNQWPEAVYSANYLVWTVAVWIACGWRRQGDK